MCSYLEGTHGVYKHDNVLWKWVIITRAGMWACIFMVLHLGDVFEYYYLLDVHI